MNLTLLLLLISGAVFQPQPATAARELSAGDLLKQIESVYSLNPDLASAREFWEVGKYQAAATQFKKVLTGSLPELAPKARFLLYKMHLEEGDYPKAAKGFAALASSYPELVHWCHYYAGKGHFLAGQFGPAEKELSLVGPDSPKAAAALELKCNARWQQQDIAGTAGCLAAYLIRFPSSAELKLLAAEVAVAEKRDTDAIALLKEIWSRHPTRSQASEAKKLLKQYRRSGRKKEASLTAAERLARAERLYRRHRHSKCLKITEALMKAARKRSEMWCRAQGLTAMATARKREETLSMPHFESFVKNCESHLTPDVLYRGVDAARKAGRHGNVEKWTRMLVKKFPESSLCDDALVLAARVHFVKGEGKKLGRAVDLVFSDFPHGDMAPDAAWFPVYHHFLEGEYSEAFKLAEKYRALLPERQNYRTNGRLLYWAGRSLHLQGKKKEALKYYTEVMQKYPLSWYALVSYLRLEERKKGLGDKTLAESVKASAPILPSLDEVVASAADSGRDLAPALHLLSLELLDEAREELEAVLGEPSDDGDPAGLLLSAFLYDRAKAYSPSHHTLRRKVPDFAYTYPGENGERWWRVAYPDAYQELTAKHGKIHGIPWTLAQGVMREESGFNPVVESYAHAWGLMQLLQKTATWVEGSHVSRRKLKDPDTNISLGVRYLKYLYGRFNHPVLSVAGYNSGPGGVLKTLARVRNRRIDEFVETIPYNQTRRYTKRVLSSAWTYQYLYGDVGGAVPFELEFPKQKPKKKKKKRRKKKK